MCHTKSLQMCHTGMLVTFAIFTGKEKQKKQKPALPFIVDSALKTVQSNRQTPITTWQLCVLPWLVSRSCKILAHGLLKCNQELFAVFNYPNNEVSFL